MKKTYFIKYVFLLFFVLSSVAAFAQTGVISGKVLDENNQPLPGATVTVKGTQKSAGTDANGLYRLTGVSGGTVTLQFSFVGYVLQEKTVSVSGNVTASVNLVPSAKNLNEVVVIGYGTQKQRDVTGAITTVSSKDFQTGTVNSPEELIQGKVAGVSITTSGGAPGAGSTILIRGGASLNASNSPLIVIDGVPLSNNGISGVANPLSLINPNDIATFTILKDAAATAIYGSRASNGVILITTKKGAAGAPRITFTTQNSMAKVEKEFSVLSADQLRSLVHSYDAANGSDYSALLGSASTDWQKEIYQAAFGTDNNLSISGTYKTMPYRLSVGYLNQDGTLKTDNMQRTTTALRLDPSFFKNTLTVALNFNGSFSKSRFANQAAIGNAISFNPTLPVYNKDLPFDGYTEAYTVDPNTNAITLNPNAPKNPLGELYDNHNTSDVYRTFGNAQITYKFPFLPALTANANFGYDISHGSGKTYIPANAAQDLAAGGDNTPYGSRNNNYTVEYYLNYTKDLKSIKSTINAQAGYGYYSFNNTTDNYPTYTATGQEVAGTGPNYAVTPNWGYTIISYYGRVIYTYDDRFTLQGSLRTDGVSRFAPSHNFGTFPGVSVGWNISNEDFLKNSQTVSDLKLRASYGVTGNQDIGNTAAGLYGYEPVYNLTSNNTQYPFGGTYYEGYAPQAYLSNVTWEQTEAYNLGLDYGFFNQRLYGTIDLYSRKTKNLLSYVPLPAGSNFTNEDIVNAGNDKSHGVEFSVTGIPVKTKDISWTISYNISYTKATITNLYLVPDPTNAGQQVGGISGGTGNYVQIQSINHSPYDFYVYQQVYGANGKPLEGVYVDRNSDGVVSLSDEYHDHNAFPPVIMGFSTSFNYKRWSLSTVLRAEIGNYVYDNAEASLATYGQITGSNTGVLNNASSAITQTGFKGYDYLSSYWVQNASFLRMDNLGLGYDFGHIFNSKNITLRANANCQNVFVITKYPGVDPEVSYGIDNSFYPRPRTYTLGLNLSL